MGNPSDIDNYLGPWAGYEGETIGELHGATEVIYILLYNNNNNNNNNNNYNNNNN